MTNETTPPRRQSVQLGHHHAGDHTMPSAGGRDALPPLPEPRVIGAGRHPPVKLHRGYTAEQMQEYARAALAAQPSPAGQGDARAQFEAWAHAQSYRGGNIITDRDADHPDVYACPNAQLTWQCWKAALAARQPVGISADWVLGYLTTDAPEESRKAIRNAFAEYAALSGARQPVAWMTHHDEPMLFPTAAEASAYCEDDEQPVPLFRSPAQAVDLGQFRDAVKFQHAAIMDSWRGDPETKAEADAQRDRLLALIDSSAGVRNAD